MPQCAVAGCSNTHRKTKGGPVRYHRFPGDVCTRTRWIKACGRSVQNCATARVCSRHFTEGCYERDVQHELLGLPTRCRLRKGAVPDAHLPDSEDRVEEEDSAIAVLLAVGLVPAAHGCRRTNGGLPLDLNKMHVMEDVREGCNAQPSSPGHAEQRSEVAESSPTSDEETPNKTPEEDIKLEDEDTSGEYTPTDDGKDDSKKSGDDSHGPSTSPKRKSQTEETPTKKAKGDLQQEFFLRNKILTDYTDSLDITNFDQIQNQTEQLLVEIQSLSDLAKEKEREWNQIVHEKKMKEELLIRIQRQKQVCLLSNGLEISETEPEDRTPANGQKYVNQRRQIGNRQKLLASLDMNGHDPKANRQRPVRDVQSIIADYRQKHPETVPRRGRRIRASVNGQGGPDKGILNFSNIALGSGSQVRQNSNSGSAFDNSTELGLLLSAMESVNQDLSAPSSTEPHDTTSFKDILVRFAKLSQSERQELLHNKPPPPYPEVTVHAVSTTTPAANSTNSLLHGILTKTQSKTTENKSAFSPTLARLLTAPERSVASQQNQVPVANHNALKSAANVSISDILSSNKVRAVRARNEITITPVGTEYGDSPKRKTNNGDEEEAEDSVDRLVIDESGEIVDARNDNNSDTGDEVPQCQGCNIKAAQFVCAGCANQWYCSRDCQVGAWDEHSEVCSG